MSVDVTGSRVRLLNAEGVATLDTDNKHMLLPTFKAGSFTLSAVDAFNTGPRVFEQTKNLGACHPNADFVTGFQLLGGLMRPIGGTTFAVCAAEYVNPNSYQVSVTGNYEFTTAIYYHYECVGGQLRARVFYRFPGGSDVTFNGATGWFWAYCGTFDY